MDVLEMKIGIVIPVSKEIPQWEVDDAIQLWQSQTRKPDEIQVIDWDKLSDKEEFFSEARCNNVATKKTKCNFLVFTNADIRPAKNVLEIIEKKLEENPNQILMCARLDLPEGSYKEGINWTESFEEWARQGHSHPAPGSIQVIPVAWLKKVGGYDERYYGWGYYDCEITRRAAMDRIDLQWIDNQATVLHLGHPILPYRSTVGRNEKLFNDKIQLLANEGKEWGSS